MKHTNQISLMNEPAKSQNKASLNSNDFKENSVAIDTQTHEEDQKIKQHVAVEQNGKGREAKLLFPHTKAL